MKYKQMPLREAFHYLKSRRHIVGPNFGFIRQVKFMRKTCLSFWKELNIDRLYFSS